MAESAYPYKIDAQWARVRGRLRAEFGEAAYKSWLKPLTFKSFEGGLVRLSAPTRFMRDWVATHYADRIRSFWQGENAAVRAIDFVVESVRESAPRVKAKADAEQVAEAAAAEPEQDARANLSAPLDR